jgi:MFS family permease
MPSNSPAQFDSPRAWLIVVAAFLAAFVTFGVTYTFGVFLKPMSTEFHVSHATATILFSIIVGLMFFVSPFTGELADKYGPRPVVAAGAVLMTLALVFTARASSFAMVVLTYGVGVGLASSCLYVPCIADVGEWFKKQRDIALGVAVSGIGCGTLVAAPVSAMLINRYGWRHSFTLFGWCSGVLLLVAAALMDRPPEGSGKVKADVMHKVRTRSFGLLYLSVLFCGVAVFIAFVFIPPYAAAIGVSRVAAAAVVGYIGASSVVGRLCLNALAPRYGLLNMYAFSFAILLASFALWIFANEYALLVTFGLVMGVGYGGVAAMSPAVTADLFGTEGLGELLGILLTGFGVSCIAGPPLAGYLADVTHDYKWPVFLATAACVLALATALPLKRCQPVVMQEEERAAGAA